ncbi:putative methionine-R-sulfoxide reductase SelR [Paraphysoderma sedebokerense]|nr:putative methionine-R-sulfoxide reductase SelR [Paraphysoderma sedebokerense]
MFRSLVNKPALRTHIIHKKHPLKSVHQRIQKQSPRLFALYSPLWFRLSPVIQMSNFPVKKSEEEWRAILSPEQFRVLRQKGTEYAGTGEYNKHKDTGVYHCAGCKTPLYKSTTKFDSGCGWPAFFDAIPGAVGRKEDNSLGMQRIEIVCNNCGGHLGHVFKGEGFKTPTDERHCVNSVSLKFSKE